MTETSVAKVGAELLEADRLAIAKILDGGCIGVIGDPWFKESITADLGDLVILLQPQRLDWLSRCRVVLIHSLWPDAPSAWESQFHPKFGNYMLDLIEICKGGRDGLSRQIPIIYWHMEGGNNNCWDMFRHFRDVADAVYTTSTDEVSLIRDEQPHKVVGHAAMGASVKLFGRERKPRKNSDGILFTGRWYADHEHRSYILQSVRKELLRLGIADKFKITNWGGNESWPEEFRKYLIPIARSMRDLADMYLESTLGINHNLWPGSVSMRYPGMMLAGLPIAHSIGYLSIALPSNEVAWDAESEVNRASGLQNWRLTSRILTMLESL